MTLTDGLLPTRGESLSRATAVLRAAGVEAPHVDAALLLAHSLGVDRVAILTHPETPLLPDAAARFFELVKRRAGREPLPYLTGRALFLDFSASVNRSVLIPRPETELLVEETAARIEPDPRLIVDVGTGSGVVAIGLARRYPMARVIAIDISESALQVARQNVRDLGVEERVQLLHGDLLTALDLSYHHRVSVIVSNPPYIPSGDIPTLQPEVARYEPRVALDGGVDGREIIQRLAAQAADWLAPGGLLAFEVGFGQAAAAKALLRKTGYVNVDTAADLSGIERVVFGRAGS